MRPQKSVPMPLASNTGVSAASALGAASFPFAFRDGQKTYQKIPSSTPKQRLLSCGGAHFALVIPKPENSMNNTSFSSAGVKAVWQSD